MSPGDASSTYHAPRLLVEVRKGGHVVSKTTVRRSPAAIGRGAEADVRLDSGHVSRLHARMFFDERGLHLKDAGSTNGFTVRGEKCRDARVEPGEVVAICEFELVFAFAPTTRAQEASLPSMPSMPSAPARAAPVDDWDSDEESDDGTDVTAIKARPAPEPPPATPAAVPQSSLMNRLMFERPPTGESAAAPSHDPDDDDEDGADDPPPLDTRAMVLLLHDEANSTNQANPYGRVVVEVIHTLNREVVDVQIIAPGTTTWWAGTPNLLESLWVVPSPARFPIVAHNRPGEYSVQVPDDPEWKIFHRGRRQVDLFRSGPFVGCVAEFDDQIEISAGPHSLYIHCRKLAAQTKQRLPLGRLIPSPELWAALGVSLVLHLGLAAMPMVRGTMTSLAQAQADFFNTPKPKDTKEPEWSAPVALAAAKPPAEVEAPPTPEKPTTPAPSPTPPTPVRNRRQPPPALKPILQPLPDTDAPEPAAPRRPTLKSVSVADFKVSGILSGLPEIQIETRGGSTLQGATATLRSGAPLPSGIVGTGPGHRLPAGRIPETQLKSVVKMNSAAIKKCYQTVQEREPGIAGKIDMEWVVTNVGSVTDVRATYDDVGSPALIRCLKGVIGDWVFPPPKGGATRVGYPFVFARTR